MIFGPKFTGYDNRAVMNIQDDCYGYCLWLIVNPCRDAYLKAIRLLGLESEMAELARSLDGFDHRTLQHTHGILAAMFRKTHAEKLQQQLPGINHKESYEDWVKGEWYLFLVDEIRRILEDSPEFARWVMIAVIYPDRDPRGIEAEEKLALFLKDKT